MRDHPTPVDTLLALVLAIVVLIDGGIASDRFVSWDEPMWAYRSARFLSALQSARWSETLVTGHPGVMTMWGGALSLWWHSEVTGSLSPRVVAAAATIDDVAVHDARQMRALGALVPIAKRGTVVLHALLAFFIYSLLRHAMGRATALGVSLALLSDPFLLGLSRLLHIDALAAQLMLAAVVALVLYQRGRRLLWLVCSAVATGLAFATKAYALILAPCALLLIATAQNERATSAVQVWVRLARDLFLWGVIAWVSVLLVWPVAARMPMQTLHQVFGLVLGYASDPDTATSTFFMGEHMASPGAAFYPVAYLLRSVPLSLLGAALAVVTLPIGVLWRGKDGQRRMVGVLLLYAVLYAALITLSQKKFDRYLLPAMLALDVAAAIVLARLLGVLTNLILRRSRTPHWWGGAMLVGGVLAQALVLLPPLAPAHYLAYYNPMAGGLRQAVKSLPVGWGEGVEEAVAWLQEQPDASNLTVAAWGVPGVAPLFEGDVVTPTAENLHRADYVLIYIGDVQNRDPVAQRFASQEPVHTVCLNGQAYAWIYRNAWEQDVLQHIENVSGPNALVVTNDNSTLATHYEGAAPLRIIPYDDESVIAYHLREASRGRDELWFVRFDAVDPARTGRITRQLAVEAILLDATPFAYGTLLHYALPRNPTFDSADPDRAILQDFDGHLRLLASGLHSHTVEHGQEVGVTLVWRALDVAASNFSVFLHLIDTEGRRWSQQDELLRNDQGEPTSLWQPGTEHVSRHTIPLPAGLPPGTYHVHAGLYLLNENNHFTPIGTDGVVRYAAVLLGLVTVRPATYPPSPDEVQVANRMTIGMGPLQLVGYRPGELQGRSGESLSLMVCWHCIDALETSYQLQFLLERDGEVYATYRLPLGSIQYPARFWRQGEVICQPYDLPLDVDLAGGAYILRVSLLDAEGRAVEGADTVPLGTAEITYVPRRVTPPQISHPVYYRLGDTFALVGLNWESQELTPGAPLRLTLVWRSLSRARFDYTVFVHLVDEDGSIISQVDTQPVAGSRPTTGWIPGEYVTDTYEIAVPSDAPVGPARVIVGMYRLETGQRLPVYDLVAGPIAGDAITLPAELHVSLETDSDSAPR